MIDYKELDELREIKYKYNSLVSFIKSDIESILKNKEESLESAENNLRNEAYLNFHCDRSEARAYELSLIKLQSSLHVLNI